MRAYLAGPDVFVREPMALAERKRAICRAHGIEGVFPLDAELQPGDDAPSALGLRISLANEALIRSCQLVLAQVTPFRGPSCDVGTAFEMGFARALGLPVFAYSNVCADFLRRTRVFAGARPRPDGTLEDGARMALEDFALEDNLMLAGAVRHSGGTWESHEAAPEERYRDLTAFTKCVERAAGWVKLAGG